jgi:hypothetical protein
MPENTDDLNRKTEEYERLADAAVDPKEKKRLQELARAARNMAPPREYAG